MGKKTEFTMKNKTIKKSAPISADERKKLFIRNIIFAVLAVLVVVALVVVIVINNNSDSPYTDVDRPGFGTGGNDSDDNTDNSGGNQEDKPSIDKLPLVPVEPAP